VDKTGITVILPNDNVYEKNVVGAIRSFYRVTFKDRYNYMGKKALYYE